jgi:hypothetical protein
MKKIYTIISIIVLLPLLMVFSNSQAAVAPEVGTYLESIDPQKDWTIMARSAIGQSPTDIDFLKTIDGSTANDYATYVLAITSIGEDPRSFGDENLVYGLSQLSTNGQMGDEAFLNDDIFGLIALVSAGVSESNSVVIQEINYIKSKQASDGGWSWDAEATEGMVDYTAMGIMALISAGVDVADSSVVDAVNFLANAQNNDGGFPVSKTGTSNTASTAWALSAIYSINADVDFYKPGGLSPIDYLEARQHADGYFLFDETSSGADLFTPVTTSYAAIALSEKFYPVSTITEPVTSSLRIEGIDNTVCKMNTQAINALDVIKASSNECGYTYVIQEYEWGPYLTTINDEEAVGNDGWIFVVNNEHLQVGANQFDMSADDKLLMYYGAWDSKLLRVVHTESTVAIGDTTTATVEQYDAGTWSAFAGATLSQGADTFTSDANGEVELTWDQDGLYYLYAEAGASIRSDKVMVSAGDVGDSENLGMSVNIEQDSGGTNPDPDPPSTIFGVSGDLSFGTLTPGQSSTKQATITNISDSSIATTATVSGSSLFTDNITLDNVVPIQWQKTIEQSASADVDVTLSVPSAYTGAGAEQGTLIFWANVMN